MEEISEEKLREHFRELLIELSDPKVNLEDPIVFEEYVTRLENIYNSDCNGIKFRHYYSGYFSSSHFCEDGQKFCWPKLGNFRT